MRHFCSYTEDACLCIAESRGEDIDCEHCLFNKDLEEVEIIKEEAMK